jgi:type I restriction enzyme M protein
MWARPRSRTTAAPFEQKMGRLTAELKKQQEEAGRLDQLIWANLEDIGYGK